jgi:hypothetical protein
MFRSLDGQHADGEEHSCGVTAPGAALESVDSKELHGTKANPHRRHVFVPHEVK